MIKQWNWLPLRFTMETCWGRGMSGSNGVRHCSLTAKSLNHKPPSLEECEWYDKEKKQYRKNTNYFSLENTTACLVLLSWERIRRTEKKKKVEAKNQQERRYDKMSSWMLVYSHFSLLKIQPIPIIQAEKMPNDTSGAVESPPAGSWCSEVDLIFFCLGRINTHLNARAVDCA